MGSSFHGPALTMQAASVHPLSRPAGRAALPSAAPRPPAVPRAVHGACGREARPWHGEERPRWAPSTNNTNNTTNTNKKYK